MQQISRVHIRNFKSIADGAVDLLPLTVFVGQNGSGKSNFIDALAFAQECLAESIEVAFKSRGGIAAVRRRSGGHPTNISIGFNLILDEDCTAEYFFEIGAKAAGSITVNRERCVVRGPQGLHSFEVSKGKFVVQIQGIKPQLLPDRLALIAASGTKEFRPVFDFLTNMRFYSIVPQHLRDLQESGPGDFLKDDGSNAAAVLKKLEEDPEQKDTFDRLKKLLSLVSSGLRGVSYHQMGKWETIQFRQDVGLKDPWIFDALNMSDGTLRVLGILLALYQIKQASVVGIEEPEVTVHPAVTELVIQVLLDSSHHKQVLVTTHSPEILEYKGLSDESLRIVLMERGKSTIAPLDQATREVIREHLFSPGELLRKNELDPDLSKAKDLAAQTNLFRDLGLTE